MPDRTRKDRARFYLGLIAIVGVIVPRRLRADWRQEWEAELRYREALLAEWDKLDWRSKLDLLRRSVGALWDALLLQPRRLEDEMFQDLRYGVRMLLKSPGFTLVAVITLALGIGANTAIFSVVNAVLLNPLPYPEADRLVVMNEAHSSTGEMGISLPNYQDWQRRAHSFAEVAASRPITLNLTGVEPPRRLSGRAMTWNFFRVLGVQPQLGRDFTGEDDATGSTPTVILSDGLWRDAFGADPQVLGRTLNLSGTAFTVIGVMPPGFEFSPQEDVYAALGGWLKPNQGWYQRDSHRSIRALARLRPGLTVEAAQSEMKSIAAQLEREYPATNSGQTAVVRSLRVDVAGEIRPVLLILVTTPSAKADGFVRHARPPGPRWP